MKVVAFDGGARRDGPVPVLLRRVLDELEAEGVETELLHLQKDHRTGCYACGQCAHKRDDRCSRPMDDGLRRCVEKMILADGVVVGSPAYDAGCSPAVQRLMQRADHVRRKRGDVLAGKPAGAVVGAGAGAAGAARALEGITDWFRAGGMIVVGSHLQGHGAGEVGGDGTGNEDAMEAMAALGRAMARELGRAAG